MTNEGLLRRAEAAQRDWSALGAEKLREDAPALVRDLAQALEEAKKHLRLSITHARTLWEEEEKTLRARVPSDTLIGALQTIVATAEDLISTYEARDPGTAYLGAVYLLRSHWPAAWGEVPAAGQEVGIPSPALIEAVREMIEEHAEFIKDSSYIPDTLNAIHAHWPAPWGPWPGGSEG